MLKEGFDAFSAIVVKEGFDAFSTIVLTEGLMPSLP